MRRSDKKIGLIQKTSRVFIVVSLLLMSLSSIALYFYVRSILEFEIEEDLYSTTARIESILEQGGDLYFLPPVVEVEITDKLLPEILKDTLIYDPSQDEIELFRELLTYKRIKNVNYKIVVRDLVVESENILLAIILSYVLIIIIVFIVLFSLNRVGSSYLWKPFFNTLDQIRQFSLTAKEPIYLSSTNILEFTELNAEIMTLTEKVRADYNNLKQFTEDVSHELQTPLAIMQVKIENVISDTSLSQKHYDQLNSLQKDIKRLTQMNKGLTLLTKIENNQFVNSKQFSIATVVEENIANFSEIFPGDIKYVKENELLVTMDLYLAGVLCNNLISNAIKHNADGGEISIEINNNSLSVSNLGSSPILGSEQLFDRFYKENHSIISTGLGLAISKKICELYNFKITYSYRNNHHVFSINFS